MSDIFACLRCTLVQLLYNWHNCRFQIWVYGNSFESFLVAVVNPNKQALENWAQDNGIGGNFKSLCENPKAKEYILGELSKIGKEKKVLALLLILAINCHCPWKSFGPSKAKLYTFLFQLLLLAVERF